MFTSLFSSEKDWTAFNTGGAVSTRKSFRASKVGGNEIAILAVLGLGPMPQFFSRNFFSWVCAVGSGLVQGPVTKIESSI